MLHLRQARTHCQMVSCWGRGWGFSRGREYGRGTPPQQHEGPQEEECPLQVQEVAAAIEHPLQPAFNWTTQRVATCNMPGSSVSSSVNNIGNNVLLNLEVDPGEREINPILGVAMCYDTGQMTMYPLIMSKTFFTNVMGNVTALTPPHMQRTSHWGQGD